MTDDTTPEGADLHECPPGPRRIVITIEGCGYDDHRSHIDMSKSSPEDTEVFIRELLDTHVLAAVRDEIVGRMRHPLP